MNMIVCDSSNYHCQFCSCYGVGYTSTIWFNQVRVTQERVVDPCSNNCFAFLDIAATIRVSPGIPVSNFKCEYDGKGGPFHPNQVCGSTWLSAFCLSEVSQIS